MSKLFDQLKKAARSRRDRSPGLLLEALQKAQERRDGPVAPPPVAAPDPQAERAPAPSKPMVKPKPAADRATASERTGPVTSRSSYAGVLLAVAIFGVTVLAWHSAPWRAPVKLKIDPTDLKLDRSLDLQRQPSKGTSSPARPS